MSEKFEIGLFPIFIISKDYGNKCFYVSYDLKFNEVIEEFKKAFNIKDTSNFKFKNNNEYIDRNKTIAELNIKSMAKIDLLL